MLQAFLETWLFWWLRCYISKADAVFFFCIFHIRVLDCWRLRRAPLREGLLVLNVGWSLRSRG